MLFGSRIRLFSLHKIKNRKTETTFRNSEIIFNIISLRFLNQKLLIYDNTKKVKLISSLELVKFRNTKLQIFQLRIKTINITIYAFCIEHFLNFFFVIVFNTLYNNINFYFIYFYLHKDIYVIILNVNSKVSYLIKKSL